MSENKHGSDMVMLGMNELTDNNHMLQDRTTSSTQMTSDIRAQVENVVALISEMVSLVGKTESHSSVSAKDLQSLVSTATTMSELSTELENVLQNAGDDTCETGTEEMHIGIVNVQRRLKMFYPDTAGLSYQDNPEGGVTVTLIIKSNVEREGL